MSSGFYNLGSLTLGLLAWAIPVWIMGHWKRRRELGHIASFFACSLALCFQMFEAWHRLEIGDVAALLDTWGAVCFVAKVLLAVTVVLNLWAAFVGRSEPE